MCIFLWNGAWRSHFFEQPFARAKQLQPGAVDNQVQFASSSLPVAVNRQTGRTLAQRCMIRKPTKYA